MLNVLANIKWGSLYYDVESNGVTLGLANELRNVQNTSLVATSIGQNMFYIYLLTFFLNYSKSFCSVLFHMVLLFYLLEVVDYNIYQHPLDWL